MNNDSPIFAVRDIQTNPLSIYFDISQTHGIRV
jgi:hypothetical protein